MVISPLEADAGLGFCRSCAPVIGRTGAAVWAYLMAPLTARRIRRVVRPSTRARLSGPDLRSPELGAVTAGFCPNSPHS